MSRWPLRVTIIVPAAMRDDANDLAMVLGSGPANARTFGPAIWEDAQGGTYSVASTQAKGGFPAAASSTLERPEWDEEPYVVNMTGAGRAQAALVVCTADDLAPLQAGKVTAIIGGNPLSVVVVMGLTRIEE